MKSIALVVREEIRGSDLKRIIGECRVQSTEWPKTSISNDDITTV